MKLVLPVKSPKFVALRPMSLPKSPTFLFPRSMFIFPPPVFVFLRPMFIFPSPAFATMMPVLRPSAPTLTSKLLVMGLQMLMMPLISAPSSAWVENVCSFYQFSSKITRVSIEAGGGNPRLL